MELYFIRHGQSEANVDKTIYTKKKDHDILLNDTGLKQAVDLGKELNYKLAHSRVDFFVSPYTRTVDTFKAIEKEAKDYSIFVTYNPLLREQEHPVYASHEEMEKERLKRKDFSLFYHRYPNAESQADVYQRVQIFLNDLEFKRLKRDVTGTVCIVAHEVVIRMFLMILDNLPVDDCTADIPNCEVIKRYL